MLARRVGVGGIATKAWDWLKDRRWLSDVLILGGIWLVAAMGDRLWIRLDQSVPSWDAADYLTGSLSYWQALQTPQWFSSQWWTNLWLMSSKIPPLVYIVTTPIISLFGKAPDQIILIFLIFSAILLGSVYGLGALLFNRRVGLWAAGFCVFMPVLYEARLEYLLDFPLTAMVALAFLVLTVWWEVGVRSQESGVRLRRERSAERSQESGFDVSAQPNGVRSQEQEGRRQEEPRLEFWLKRFWAAVIGSLKPKAADPPFTPPQPPTPNPQPWLWAIAAGLAIGLALMTKQSAGLFLLVPLLWCGAVVLWQRDWGRLAQWLLLLLATVPVWFPWYRTNWLLILTSSKRATIDSAAIQGSPSLLSLDAWTFYLRYVPWMVSWPLVVLPLVGLLCFWRRSRVGCHWRGDLDYEAKSKDYRQQAFAASQRSLLWLLIFLGGAYLLSTLNPNKDTRYFAPALPVLAVVLAYGLTLLPRSWRLVQWGSVALAGILMISALFPIFAYASFAQQPVARPWFPARSAPYPHSEVIAEVRQTSPYLRSTIGVLPSTPALNQHNVNFFGLSQYFQVYGRQVGTRQATLTQDRRSLSWFLSKTGDQGSMRRPEIQAAMVQGVEQSGEFAVQKSWLLPDQSRLQLFTQRVPPIQVKQLEGSVDRAPVAPIQLEQITVPAQVPPGKPIPVTYQWSGTWANLQQGLVLLTWHRTDQPTTTGRDRWLHDHAIGMGMLFPAQPRQVSLTTPFRVTERLAMLSPAVATPGTYELTGVYLRRPTGKTTPVKVPPVTLRLDPTADPAPAPELDLLTQLRSLAGTLPKGPQSLERISNEINRINQYDPVQDYLLQSQQAMQSRLQTEPTNRTYAYTLALATVLRRQVNDAIAALETVTQLDPQNPYAHAYLGFVNLYDFRPGAAQTALNTALKLNPDSPEIQALSGIAALMRGNLMGVWQHGQAYQKAERFKG